MEEEIRKEKTNKEKRQLSRTEKEWILVICASLAIMFVFACQLIRFIAKDNAIKDRYMLDSVHTAILTAMIEPEVIYADDNSKEQIEYLMSPGSKLLSSVESGTKFYDTVVEIMGWNVFNTAEQRAHMRSVPAQDDGEIMIEPIDETHLVLWVIHSDYDGWGRDYSATDVLSLTNEIFIE